MKLKILILLFISILYIPCTARTITIIYDDSGSMKKGNKWVYANYALQSLIGLQNKSDKIFMVKMSDFSEDNDREYKLDDTHADINMGNKSEVLEEIRERYNTKSNLTPYESVLKGVEISEQYINNQREVDENWIVIITDGEFEDGKEFSGEKVEKIKSLIYPYIEKSRVRPIFLVIAENSEDTEKIKGQVGIKIWKDIFGTDSEFPKIFCAVGNNEISERMNQIGNIITGRSNEQGNSIFKTNNNTISFKPEFPLKRIIVFQQNNNKSDTLKIEKVNGQNLKYNIENTIQPSIEYKDIAISANITPITPNKGTIGNGEVNIYFDKPITNQNINVLFEVAAKFKVELIDEQTGNPVNCMFYNSYPGAKLKIIGRLISTEDNTPIPYSIKIRENVYYDKKVYPLTYNIEKNYFETELIALEGKKSISASAEFQGYFNFQSEIYTINANVEPPRKINAVIESNTMIINQTEINNLKINIIPYLQDKLLKADEFGGWKCDTTFNLEKYVIKKGLINSSENGQCLGWELKPKYNSLFPYLIPTGEFKLSTRITTGRKDEVANCSIKIVIKKESFLKVWGMTIFAMLLALILIAYCFGLLRKNRFKKKAKILYKKEYKRVEEENNLYSIKTKIFSRYFIPYKAEEYRKNGIVFIAGENNSFIYVSKKSLASLVKDNRRKVTICGQRVITENVEKCSNKIYDGNFLEIITDNCKETFTYKKNC